MAPLVVQSAIRYGARPLTTNALPKIEAPCRYRADVDGAEFILTDDHLAEVQSLLQTAFGPPAVPAKTNANGNVLGVYAAPITGAAIQFGREERRDGACYTTILIVSDKAVKR